MRSVLLSVSCLLALASPLLAQQRPPLWFSEAERARWAPIHEKINEAFDLKEYERATELLAEEMKILLEVQEKLETGKLKMPKHERATEEQLLAVAKQDLRTQIAGSWYNRACGFSMTGESGPAIEALKKSIELGYVNVEHFRADTDLDPIREEPGYKEALALIEYNQIFLVHVPAGLGEGPAPLLVFLHSARSNEERVLKALTELADERKMILLAPRAPITIGPGQYEWKSYSLGKENGIRKVAESIAAVRDKHPIDTKRIFVMGARQGGEFATLFAVRHPDKVAGAGQVNSYWNRFDYADDALLAAAAANGVKLCLLHGKEDPFYGKAEEAVEAFQKAKIETKLITFEGGEDLPAMETFLSLLKQALGWLDG
jgi:predicted esterase